MAADELEVAQPSAVASRLRNLAPPLTSLAVVLLITLAILPSALNLPQTNPSTVLEYAPIPPEDESTPPFSGGGLGSLGLAGSSSLTSAAAPAPALTKKNLPPVQQQKRCVKGRQTEDPNAPPCQAFFDGNNFGSTWQGVTPDEVTVLYYMQVGTIIDQGQGQVQPTPDNGVYCDADLLDCDGDGEADDDTDKGAHMWVKDINALSRYFNNRFQTYGRYIHFWIYWTSADSPATRKGDAADNWERLKPFAVLMNAWNGGYEREYIAAMALRNTMVFGAFQGQPRSYFTQYAPKIWGYWPDVENWADMFVGFLCNKVAGTKVSRGPFAGQDRVYGLLSTRDPAYENFQLMAKLTKSGAQGCGINFAAEKTFRRSGYWFNNEDHGEDRTEAETNMADFSGKKVNTIIWPGGSETNHSTAASHQVPEYHPEWIVAGDGDLDGRGFATRQDQDAWEFAWTQTYQLREDNREANPGYQAYKEADPDGTDVNWAVTFYRDMFMLFTGIQVSGPRLAPKGVDAGFHAIQRRESTSPYTASCWFHPGDFSCVKDSAEAWWDRNGTTYNNDTGCYRMVNSGARFAADRWASAKGAGINTVNYANTGDPCTSFGGNGVAFQPGA